MIKPNKQQSLFKYTLSDSGCSLHQAELLFKEKLLSFNPTVKEEYERYEIEELQFLKNLFFDSGLPSSMVKSMLSNLEKPYSYSFLEIYWDFANKRWEEFQTVIEKYISVNVKEVFLEYFNEYLDTINVDDEEDMENLKKVRNKVNGFYQEITRNVN